ncbi:FixH family protein [Chitinophaga terrae (ex Kim and Jung 2007)]|nr:FixH family protein [Chitinophaga terrae (ex Kim and Jung 2007)]GEP92838.1 hypothetical protein CTE07_44830 [Chitinophaga terrae (ex Kim and Jung 2007)]
MKSFKLWYMNWGYKIIIVFVLFAAGMLTLVAKSLRTRIDMVTPDYYKEELRYQQVIDGKRNASGLSAPLGISQSDAAIVLTFPAEMRNPGVNGELKFYRPSDAGKDINVPLKIAAAGEQQLDKQLFTKGLYKVIVQWTMNDRPFYMEEMITVN